METSGKIFAIEEFSTFDGPGIRTTIFLKGCPLRCTWCHNPEGQIPQSEILRSPHGDIIRISGEDYTVKELTDKIEKNIDLLNKNGGGVTFSGGEPLCQREFLTECLKNLNGSTHRAVQTSGYCEGEEFTEVLKNAEYILYDLKIINNQKHIEFTGQSNEKIIANFFTLARSNIEFCIRIPLIPTVTDTKENIKDIACLMNEAGVSYCELMPYNKMAGGKYSMLGRKYMPNFDEIRESEIHEDIFQEHNIQIKIL